MQQRPWRGAAAAAVVAAAAADVVHCVQAVAGGDGVGGVTTWKSPPVCL